jgi:hypothetical protein
VEYKEVERANASVMALVQGSASELERYKEERFGHQGIRYDCQLP